MGAPLELWIGLVQLKPLNREVHGYAGAFTSIVTWACDVEGFCKKAEAIAASLGMFVVDVKEAEPLTQRTKSWTLSEEVEDMVRRAESNPNAIIYGAFHCYPFDEA
jgi:hypothetical protein